MIANNTVTDNHASTGGGIFCYHSSPTITTNAITLNIVSDYGGGIYCTYSSPAITSNTITQNSSTSYYGGGICCSISSPTIADNTIAGNSAYSYGGGIVCQNSSASTITRNAITGNLASESGGGIYCAGSSATIANCTITGNNAGNGGGVFCRSTISPRIVNSIITGNTASSGAGIYCYDGSSPTVSNCAITENHGSVFGGGFYSNITCSPNIANCTITGNSAPADGGVCCFNSSPTITNTIVAFNSAGIRNIGANFTFRYNCVYGNGDYGYSGVIDPTGSNGNISTDPKLPGVPYGNVHILPDSPCVDAGDDTVVQTGCVDMDGESRIQGDHVDIGADESDGTWHSPVPPAVVRVAPEGDDGHDGSSWVLAKKTVQAGIDAAAITGGEVWVKNGTYLERIMLLAHVHVYGGFAGIETQVDQRDAVAHPTILDGQAAGSVVTVRTGYRVSTLDSLTIRNGLSSCGGGVYCDSASPAITGCTITGNNSSSFGAGIGCENSSSPRITSCTISANIASSYGGGIYCKSSSPQIANCTITGNTGTSGGGVYYSGSSPTIANCTIGGNNGGGIFCSSSSPAITNCTITGNSGGGISCSSSSPMIANCTIKDAPSGGGVYCYSSSPIIANCTITGNKSSSTAGGVHCYSSSATIVNTILAFNSSGIYKTGSPSPGVRYNCVYGNTAYNYSGMIDPTGVDGNISEDPKVAAVNHGNTHIQPNSPCVDAGDDTVVRTGWVDMDEQPRIQGVHVDIGADESDGTWYLPSVFHVASDGDDSRDGSTWELAKRTVQGGINAATASGGEVWVKTGTYFERITLAGSVHVYGGFAGTETLRSGRDATVHPTILDAQGMGSVVTARTGSDASTIDSFTIRNAGGRSAAGIFCYSSVLTINCCTITGNNAAAGGGVYCYSSSPIIVSCTIAGNRAALSGGGVYCDSSSPKIVNSTIAGNTASSFGGGVYCLSSSPIIANCTITGNSATSSGGGIYCYNSAPTIANTIVAFNSSGIYKTGSATPVLRHDNVYGNTGYNYSGLTDPTGTSGNISASPLFVDADGADNDPATWADNDYRLAAGSACIDAGDNAAVPVDATDLDADGNMSEPIPLDLGRATRLLEDPATPNTGAGAAPIVDIGAYEYVPPIPYDFDHDRDVDQADLTIFELCVTGPVVPGPPVGCTPEQFDQIDADSDGDVDQVDFGVFQRCYSGDGNPSDPGCAQ